MSRYWKCTMTNDEDSFRVGDVYETDDEKRNFIDGANFYFVEQCIDELSIASFEEVIEETKEELKMQKYGDKYWKCTYSEGDWFKKGKIYITDVNGRNTTDEHGMKLTWSIPIDFIPKYRFEEVTHEEWMEQEYKAYYEEEARMNNNRYWKCVSTKYYGFKEGNTYVTDQDKKNYIDESNYTWSSVCIDDLGRADFEEVNKYDSNIREETKEKKCDKSVEITEEEKEKNIIEDKSVDKKRYWECTQSCDEHDFAVGLIYTTNKDKLHYVGNDGYTWTTVEIDDMLCYKFVEVDKCGNELKSKQLDKKEENTQAESNYEMVNHPPHYNSNSKGIEVIDVMEAFTEGLVGIDAIDIGTAIKYIGRLGKKDNPVQEVKKAIWYLQHYVDRKEKENDNN